ncbi:MAG: DNA damage-inducible protein D [Veillonella sp.]|jgi:DNA-damage-inducible protein D|nr:DNA damage-inducible protein D [Veillonella sp.]
MFFFFPDGIPSNSNNNYHSPFESIKQIDNDGNEYWFARDLQEVLEYSEWRNFSKIIEKAKNACETSGHRVQSEFVDTNKLVDVGANLQRSIQDIVLSRYACYLIAMNGDPRKEVIALAQTYFAVKTHEQEQLELQKEDSLRLQIRQDIKEHNISLAEAANQAGIKGKPQANKVHHDVGAKVRQTIKELGGTMPEDLATPTKSIQQIKKEKQKKLSK